MCLRWEKSRSCTTFPILKVFFCRSLWSCHTTLSQWVSALLMVHWEKFELFETKKVQKESDISWYNSTVVLSKQHGPLSKWKIHNSRVSKKKWNGCYMILWNDCIISTLTVSKPVKTTGLYELLPFVNIPLKICNLSYIVYAHISNGLLDYKLLSVCTTTYEKSPSITFTTVVKFHMY